MAKRTIGVYKSYNFRDKDPVIGVVEDAIKAEEMSYQEVADASGVSYSTLHNWFLGTTCRPQFATLAAVMYSLNYRCEWTKGKTARIVKVGKA